MCDSDKYYKETSKYTDENGNDYEVNEVVYERDDKSVDYVKQTKCNGIEIGHHTEHPDGTVHDYGVYEDDKDSSD